MTPTTVPLQPPPASAGEHELTERAAAGDLAAFATIMRRHNRMLYRTARSILRNDAEAEEAVQEGYLRAYRAMAGFRNESSLATWLTRIVINEALGRLRKRRREVETIAADNVIDFEAHIEVTYKDRYTHESPEHAAMRQQMRELLERRIDQLPAAFRTVFVLRALEEMPVEEIARCMGIEQTTVRTRFLRARRLLRDSLAADIGNALEDAFAFEGKRCDRIVCAVLKTIAGA